MKGFRRYSSADVLTVAIDADDTTISYAGILQHLGTGSKVEIDGEILFVTEADATNTVATVVRGWLETTAVSHDAGSAIYIEPRIWRDDVVELFNDCLEDLPGRDLFAIGSQDIIHDGGLIGYGLDAEAIKVLKVSTLQDSQGLYWKPINDWYLVTDANPVDFPNGKALMNRVSLGHDAELRVTYARAFVPITSEAQDLEMDILLKPYMVDLLFYFAMNRLMVDQERQRSRIEGAQSHQRAQDVPPFLALRTGEWYQARYDDRARSARTRLIQEVGQSIGTGYGS